MTLATQEKGFPCGSAGKESACNAGGLGSIPGLGRFPWRRERLPTPVFWPGEFHGVAKSQTRLSDFHFTHTQEMDQTAPRHIRLKLLCSSKCSLSLWFSDKNHFSVFRAHLYEKSFLFCWIQISISSANDIYFLDFKKPRRWKQRRQWQPTPVLLPGKSHGWRSLVGCGPWGCEESDTTEQLPFDFSFSCIGEGNGNPLQCSCLENPRDGGAWWAAVYGVAQSQTRLEWLSSSSI